MTSQLAPDAAPALLDSQVEPAFWDRMALKYSKQAVRYPDAYERWVARVKQLLTTSDRVLEVGCGTGTTALKFAPHVGELLATDVSPAMIDIARKKANEAKLSGLQFRTGTLADPSLEPGSFDVVMAFNVLHLLPDVPAAFERAHELLRPGGLFISKTPCLGDQTVALRWVVGLMRLFGRAPFVNFVNEKQLISSTERAGLGLFEHDYYPRKSRGLLLIAKKPERSHQA